MFMWLGEQWAWRAALLWRMAGKRQAGDTQAEEPGLVLTPHHSLTRAQVGSAESSLIVLTLV